MLNILDMLELSGLAVAFAAFLIGMKFPDWDFKLRLRHRSIITHSPLVIFMLIAAYNGKENNIFRMYIAAFSMGLAVHMIFDFFPVAWTGGALLKIPFKRITCKPKTTKNFFLLTIFISSFISIYYTKNILELFLLFFLGISTIIIKRKHEEKLYRPTLLFLIFVLLIGGSKYVNIY